MEAKEAFLASGITNVTASGNVMSKFHCLHKCLRLRATRNSYTACNGFLLEGGVCKMGYMSPDWVLEQARDPGDAATIFFDLILK